MLAVHPGVELSDGEYESMEADLSRRKRRKPDGSGWEEWEAIDPFILGMEGRLQGASSVKGDSSQDGEPKMGTVGRVEEGEVVVPKEVPSSSSEPSSSKMGAVVARQQSGQFNIFESFEPVVVVGSGVAASEEVSGRPLDVDPRLLG